MKHILTASQFTEKQITDIFATADKMRHSPWAWTEELQGKLLGTLFYEPSTRTRLSFEAAMTRLGGHVLTVENAATNSSKVKGESLEDAVQTLSQYVDCIVLRYPYFGAVEQASAFSSVPVINAGDGSNEHPTQALLDLYTIIREHRRPQRLKILFTGDMLCSRTAHSLIRLLLGFDFEIFSTAGTYNDLINIITEASIPEHIGTVDVLYLTRYQQERDLLRTKPEFVLTPELVEKMKKTAIIMHPLPRGPELPRSIDALPQAIYLKKQVQNGMWVRMALLWKLLGNTDH